LLTIEIENPLRENIMATTTVITTSGERRPT